jgi:hypothetical protein
LRLAAGATGVITRIEELALIISVTFAVTFDENGKFS